MKTAKHKTFPRIRRESEVFESMGQAGTVILDSTLDVAGRGRQSLMATDPAGYLRLVNGRCEYRTRDSVAEVDAGLFLGTLEQLTESTGLTAVGYIGYETAVRWPGVEPRHHAVIPEAWFWLYDDVELVDAAAPLPRSTEQSLAAEVAEQPDQDWYHEQVKRIKEHIREGDIYQANFTARTLVTSGESPEAVYLRLRELNPSPYGAFMNFGDFQVLSSSPERMFLRNGTSITSCPIKGTIARGNTMAETITNKRHLLRSDKDRAELLMIVDLVRNDLGRIAQTGSVSVDSLYRAEEYSSVIHLVSDVSARLRDDTGIADICQALMPGGSITGAPKRRAAEIINDLEATARGVYTGCIGYVQGNTADFNIAIRTMVHHDGSYAVHAGGGIVADSDPELEYEEMQLKARNLMRALGVTV